ncbi:MAG TPA: hypothetical protein VGT81_23795 [Casimicrobiaceae bacterium]|nr:hypothetical protein [Casimicrobiaceae bacterium]
MLAVLPFKHLGRSEDAYFTDGVTEELTHRLASLPGIGVISRTSADQYKGTSKGLRQVADELGVQYVLEGSVEWDSPTIGNTRRLRVTPHLVRVRDDRQVWAERYDAPATDVFTVQGDIAGRVADALDVALRAPARRALSDRPTDNLDAWGFYVRAKELSPQLDMETRRGAVSLLERAIALDPHFGYAIASASGCRMHI